MARARTLKIAGINIRKHSNQSPEEYQALWQELFLKKGHVTFASNALAIGEVRKKDDTAPPNAPLLGYFYRFLEIELENPWFNLHELKKASEESVGAVSIPDGLKPNFVEIPYVFDLVKHKLFFVCHDKKTNLSPNLVLRLLEKLCSGPAIFDRFGIVDLTLMSDKQTVAELLSWPVINSLTITIQRPNGTELDDEALILGRLNALQAGEETITYKKAEGTNSLLIDDQLKRLANVAADNGSIEIKGVNGKHEKMEASSKSYPKIFKILYDPVETLHSVLLRLAEAVHINKESSEK